MENRLDGLLKKALSLPMLPGVYIMKNDQGKIIYIGKAKRLKNRVVQYFRSGSNHTEKVRQMVSNVSQFDTIICDSEFEALILECSLIKQNQPKYNVLLKDDKGYHYIHVSDEDWPRVNASVKLHKTGENIGPYNTSYYLRQAVDEAKKIYKLPLCSKVFSDGMKKCRPCLNYYIGICLAPCAGKCTKSEYKEAVGGAVNFLKRGSDETVKQLKEEMQKSSDDLEFEKAAKLRDRITAIEKLHEKQKVVMSKVKNQDVIAFVEGKKHACFEVFKFRNGQLCDREDHFVSVANDDKTLRAQFLMQYYTINEIPTRILVDGEVDSQTEIEKYLSDSLGKKVVIAHAQKGEQKALIEMCKTNAAERVAQKEGLSVKETAVLDELRTLLGLKAVPRRIEAYDISNTAGANNVAGLVVFEDGKPNKKLYRKFAIKSFEGQDDYASMREVITRRLYEFDKNKGDDLFGVLPDLILLDGGKGQLSAVTDLLEKYDLKDKTFGMVKDNSHKTRALVSQYGEIAIKPTKSVFTFVSNVQNEVHRFAIGYHHKKNKMVTFAMQLTEIEGVGKQRAANLLKELKSLDKISKSSIQELMLVKGITKTIAENIYNYYH